MLKRCFVIAVILCMILCAAPTGHAIHTVPEEISAISIKNVLLYEAVSGSILYEKNAKETAFPASTTKVLTAIIVIDLCEGNCLLGNLSEYFKDREWLDPDFASRTFSMDDVVTVTDPETRGSTMHIRHGEQLTVRDLMYGMMLISGNDCARALAIYFSPSKESKVTYFAELMNAYAKALGADNSNFVVPHGLHVDEHTTTAYDMALITKYALNNTTFRQIVGTETYTIEPTNKNSDSVLLENTNRLIHVKTGDEAQYFYKYSDAIGVKTGDTDSAGKCLIAAAERNGMQLIVVLFGDFENVSLGPKRYEAAIKLFNYGFDNFELVNASGLGIEPSLNAAVEGANTDMTELKVDLDNAQACIHRDDKAEISANAKALTVKTYFSSSDNKLHAPLKEGEKVGYAEYYYGTEVVFTADLFVSASMNIKDGKTITGVAIDPTSSDDTVTGNEWIFWLLLFCIVLVIILVIVGLTKQPVRRRNSQLRRKRHR